MSSDSNNDNTNECNKSGAVHPVDSTQPQSETNNKDDTKLIPAPTEDDADELYFRLRMGDVSEQEIELYSSPCYMQVIFPDASLSKNGPTEIIPNLLYLGSMMNAFHIEHLQELNIKLIVNCAKEIQKFHPKHFKYIHYELDDDEDQKIEHLFEESYNIIHKSIENNEPVLVHCAAGVSRSATIVISYMMQKHNWGFKQAFTHVQAKRLYICPNDGFQKSLFKLEKKLTANQQQ